MVADAIRVLHVVVSLGTGWHTVMATVRRWGRALLDADTGRIAGVGALGLEEILMFRRGRCRKRSRSPIRIEPPRCGAA